MFSLDFRLPSDTKQTDFIFNNQQRSSENNGPAMSYVIPLSADYKRGNFCRLEVLPGCLPAFQAERSLSSTETRRDLT